LRVEYAKELGKLILIDEVERCFGEIYGAFSNHVLTFGQRVAPIICSTLGVEGSENTLKIQQMLDDEHERIIEDIKRSTTQALRDRRYRPEQPTDDDE